jgi:hypothetical protein
MNKTLKSNLSIEALLDHIYNPNDKLIFLNNDTDTEDVNLKYNLNIIGT